MMKEEILLGGTMNDVARVGDTVRRQVKHHWQHQKGHPQVHLYLQFLEKKGMAGVPRFLGIDEHGREILSYVPGETAESGLGFDATCLHSDQAICDMARFMRKLHDISVDFLPIALKNGWSNPQLPKSSYETICHGDAAIWNFALVDKRIAGIFDFDQACPGSRAWDLTLTLFSAVLVSCYDYVPSKHEDDTRWRIRLFFDAYGMKCPVDIIKQTANRLQVWCNESDARGEPSVHYQNWVAHLRTHVNDWV